MKTINGFFILMAVTTLNFELQTLNCFAQPGSLDTTFSFDGKVTTAIGSSGDYGYSVAIQSDGKIVVAGNSSNGSNSDFALVRYNSNGTLDTTFSSDGKVTTAIGSFDDVGLSIAIQSDGKIVVAGRSFIGTNWDFSLARYNSDGTLDTTFSSDGKVTTAISSHDNGYSVTIQSDGKIVVAGQSSIGTNWVFSLARYNSDGSLDNTFDTDGKVTTAIGSSGDYGYSVAIQSDGKIVVAGNSYNGSNYDFALVRYNSDGTLDNTFDSDGKIATSIGSSNDNGYSLAIQSDGKIVVAGNSYNGSNYDFALARYNSDGTLDNTFDSDGKVTTAIGSSIDEGRSVAIQSDGKIMVAGQSSNGTNYDFALVRFNSDGTLDNTFDSDGKVTTAIGSSYDEGYSVAIQIDDNIVVAGYSNNDFAVARYNTVCSSINFSQSPTICNGQSITVGSNAYTMNGIYLDTLTAANGCDSIVTTNLTVLQNNSFSQSLTINNGDSIQVGNSYYNVTNTYVDTLISVNGCDSIVTTNLTVLTRISTIALQNTKVKIYPNPFTNSTTIEIKNGSAPLTTGVELRICDVLRQEVYRQTLSSSHKTLNLNLTRGIYFYKVRNENEVITNGKLVVE